MFIWFVVFFLSSLTQTQTMGYTCLNSGILSQAFQEARTVRNTVWSFGQLRSHRSSRLTASDLWCPRPGPDAPRAASCPLYNPSSSALPVIPRAAQHLRNFMLCLNVVPSWCVMFKNTASETAPGTDGVKRPTCAVFLFALASR